jgi:hypothetical protein
MARRLLPLPKEGCNTCNLKLKGLKPLAHILVQSNQVIGDLSFVTRQILGFMFVVFRLSSQMSERSVSVVQP